MISRFLNESELLMLWVKALHIAFMVTWFAGLFYLPRLFVYHAMATDTPSIERFKIMERKLYFGIMTPGAVLTVRVRALALAGLRHQRRLAACEARARGDPHCLSCVLRQAAGRFQADANRHSHVWYRWFNELPVVLLLAIVLLAVVKPI
jgi:putative membrane protein